MNSSISKKPYVINGKVLKINKAINKPNYLDRTILTDDIFTFVDFHLLNKPKAIKFNPKLKKPDGVKTSSYAYKHYWNQARRFYEASKILPFESKALTSYYCILNAAKAYIVYKSTYLNPIINSFKGHGLNENPRVDFKTLENIEVQRKSDGVFVLFSKMIDKDFEKSWPTKKPHRVKATFSKYTCNTPFIHNNL